jgi:hypothetical protein
MDSAANISVQVDDPTATVPLSAKLLGAVTRAVINEPWNVFAKPEDDSFIFVIRGQNSDGFVVLAIPNISEKCVYRFEVDSKGEISKAVKIEGYKATPLADTLPLLEEVADFLRSEINGPLLFGASIADKLAEYPALWRYCVGQICEAAGTESFFEHFKKLEDSGNSNQTQMEFLKNEAQNQVQSNTDVEGFLKNLNETVRTKVKQYDRILKVLWHCYLDPQTSTQLEVAAILGVSDSLVSDYRQRIEQELRALSFSDVDVARAFEATLRDTVYRKLFPENLSD